MKNPVPGPVMLVMILVAGTVASQTPAPDSQTPVAVPATPNAAVGRPLAITGLVEDATNTLVSADGSSAYPPSHVGLGGKLWVLLNEEPPLTADKYVLFLNGSELKRIGASKASYGAVGRPAVPALVFTLERNDDNAALWNGILGAPKSAHVPVTVSLGERAAEGSVNQSSIVAAAAGNATFLFRVFSVTRLLLAIGVIAVVMVLVWGHARSRSTLRDSYLPQLEPARQTYSLARWQMAFWFTLVFSVFIFLFLLLGDTNTITAQALSLMGISGLTAICAEAVDAQKYSPADAANRGLRALGLDSYEDVIRVRKEIEDRQTELGSTVDIQRRQQLTIEISDRNSVLRTYDDKTRLFTSQGWFTDISTDLNGTALHRLQVLCWTVTLGCIFVYLAYRNLSMPEFNGTLLALMGISSAGYVGFKFQEVNN
ncbi:MAG TPA: hypothetical protein VGI93_01855 [Steroidobacteraceae bacterium]|jgi:hypothetical protein